MEKRLFIVSNRLPLTIDEEKGIQPVSGGLVSSLSSYLEKQEQRFAEVYWTGVPGCLTGTWIRYNHSLEAGIFKYIPVFVPSQEYESYYNGLANSVIWPLFHYFPSFADYQSDWYKSYRQVNTLFAEVLLKHLRPGDVVWIHDYHLLPLAALLRQQMPDISIGFFLHIPFPSFELFRLLPRKWQEEILRGILGADLIGFHTMDYASHFLQSVLTVLGLDNERHVLHHDNRLIKVDVFPISIDFKKYHEAYHLPEIVRRREDLVQKMAGKKIIFSVDRLDYTKGVHNRLKAFDLFLQQNPGYHHQVVFILVIVPSRDTIPKYMERKRMIDELISNINSKTGNINWIPVIYQYNHLSFEEMMALYGACDLALITPLRDGMNLVAKEFVASRADNRGVLVVSEMAGAARELTDALVINPNDIEEMAQKIKEGLEMPPEAQSTRLAVMQKRIHTYDIHAWAEDFMRELNQVKHKQQLFRIQFIDEFTKRQLYDRYRQARRKLLLLDYDGTLKSFTINPDDAIPDQDLLTLLQALAETVGNSVFIISGRSSTWLERHFGHLPVNLVAEHGARYKQNGQWLTEIAQQHQDWKDQVQQIMEMYVRRCANTFIEEKEFSMVWHYRNANMEQGKLKAFELANDLKENIRKRNMQVLLGNKIVEVRQSGFNKGSFVKNILQANPYDFTLAIGDDMTDEDMFKVLINRDSYTIKVGTDASYAKYNLHSPQMVISLLEGLRHLPVGLPIQ